jgi:ATP-dependent Clp protease ATP-binding subunit ClpC
MVLGEVKRTFNPEFINRIDEIIVFDALGDEDLRRIMSLLVEQLNGNLKDRRIKINLAPEVIDWIIDVTCKDRSYGARPLRRAIQRYVEDPLADEVLKQGPMTSGSTVLVERDFDSEDEERPLKLTIIKPKKPPAKKADEPEREKVAVGAEQGEAEGGDEPPAEDIPSGDGEGGE